MNSNTPVEVTETVPGAEEYCALRKACGLSAMTLEAATKGLPLSLYAVTIREGKTLIGMGRIVGDGLHVQIVDIAIHPMFQKRGLSRIVMEKLMAFVESDIAKCAIVSLFADIDWLYQKFGFAKPEESFGMLYTRK